MLVKVAAYQSAIEAHLARGRLEAEGIPAFICHEHHVWANWLYSLLLGGVKLYVHARDEDRAREIVGAYERGEYSLPDEEPAPSCPRCASDRVTLGRTSWKAALLSVNLAQIPLYFAWATPKCGVCGHEWDLPGTRTYSLLLIAIAGLLTALALFALFVGAGCVLGKIYYGETYLCRIG